MQDKKKILNKFSSFLIISVPCLKQDDERF